MSARIGAVGRQARRLASGRQVRQRAAAAGGPLPLQRTASREPTEQRHEGEPGSPPAESVAGGAIEREREAPTPQDVAERVYCLFTQELRREQERRGLRPAG